MSSARVGADEEAVDGLDGRRRGCAGHLGGSLGSQWKRRGRILGAQACKGRRCTASSFQAKARVAHGTPAEAWAGRLLCVALHICTS